jgi:hypothetical protein
MLNQSPETVGGYIESLIDDVYQVLTPDELFSKAKRHSWQTFFHHSASVAAVSYRLAEMYKSNLKWDVSKLEISRLEKSYGLPLEVLAFLLGIVHDYAKLYRGERELGREKGKDILRALVSRLGVDEKKASTIVSTLIPLVSAVEGTYAPEVENALHIHVAKLVGFADKLMYVDSIDEAMPVLLMLKKELDDMTGGAVKVGYVKASLPSLLQAKISEKLINMLRERGWTPLLVYYDGVVVIGGTSAAPVPLHVVAETVKEEVSKTFSVGDALEELANRLSGKKISTIYSRLEQTRTKTPLGGEDPVNIYHDIIVKYLSGTPIGALAKELAEVKGKRGENLIDVRTLATGLERGSKYFEEYLGAMLATKASLVNSVLALKNSNDGRRKAFLILSYMTAFASKDFSKVLRVVNKAFNLSLPASADKNLVYAVAMAEVYKRLESDEEIRRVVEVAYGELGLTGTADLDYYVSRFVLTSIKSNIIDAGSANSTDELTKPVSYRNYCRVCGTPLLSESIAFIEYARAARAGGGSGSEMWLHDDPPLASLEDIATDKSTRIRFICPLCYYEAKMLSGDYKPPFLVIALHPAVAYDVWAWLVKRLTEFKLEVPGLSGEVSPEMLAEEYAAVASEGFKVVVKGRCETRNQLLAIIDSLGARVIIPLRADLSIKLKGAVKALLIAPRAMSLAGGGQVGLAANLAHIYNLGVETLPVVLPHNIPLLYDIQRAFEAVMTAAKGMGERVTQLDRYSVYNMSYLVILEALYAYSIKVLAWYSRWRRKEGTRAELEDYALKMLEHMSSIPHVPLALASTPPPSLDPREGDEQLPYYALISYISRDVETRMSQLQWG